MEMQVSNMLLSSNMPSPLSCAASVPECLPHWLVSGRQCLWSWYWLNAHVWLCCLNNSFCTPWFMVCSTLHLQLCRHLLA